MYRCSQWDKSLRLRLARGKTIYQLAYIETGPPARSAKIEALQNVRKLCFEWRIGENDARTLAVKVAAAAKPPQTNPLHIGTHVDARGGNGEYRRRRVSGGCAYLDRRFPLK
jgi:hypothetical protein